MLRDCIGQLGEPAKCGQTNEALGLPVGDQFVQRARVHHRAGQDVGADFGTLLDQADIDPGIELLETDRGGESGRTAADDDDVEEIADFVERVVVELRRLRRIHLSRSDFSR